jgi:hypothetical protein
VGGSESSWRYQVVAGAGARSLAIEAWLPPGSLADLVVRVGAERFVEDLEIEQEGAWRQVQRSGATWRSPLCALGCHLRYRFELAAAAAALHDTDLAVAWGEVYEAAPSLWLLHPSLAPAGVRYRFRVRTAPGVEFVTGVFRAQDAPPGGDTYEADASTLDVSPYGAFGPMRLERVAVADGAIVELAIGPGLHGVQPAALLSWTARSARTIGRYLGCFPLERVLLLVVPAPGDRVAHGEMMGDGGASIVVELGEHAGGAALDDDWVLPHEMAHLAVPSVSRQHHWIEEGLAVYLQPIARARAGELRPEQVWREFAMGMPQGAPAHGGFDRGLDGTPDWARTYWGGATFCLLADVEIRSLTGNRLGLEDAVRGVLAAGGSVAQIWDLRRLLETADLSVGWPVLRAMHDRLGEGRWRVDLPRLFRDLGVNVDGDRVTLDNSAPLAAVRRAITEPLPPSTPEPSACRWAAPGRVAQR